MLGKFFKVVTDDKPASGLLNAKDIISKLQQKLLKYDSKGIYKLGSSAGKADTLSRSLGDDRDEAGSGPCLMGTRSPSKAAQLSS